MNDIQVFENPEFGKVRTLENESGIWFVAVDVCAALGIKNSRDALTRLDKDEMTVVSTDSHSGKRGGAQSISIVNEPGLYSLVLSSRKPEAKAFKRWITHDVIPSIRKHGAYMTPDTLTSMLTSPDNLIKLLEVLKGEQDKNKELKMVNAALSEQAQDWDDTSILNALVRAYGHRHCNNCFGVAWNTLYKNLRYKEHINLKIRKGRSGRSSARYLDFIKPGEMPRVIKTAVAMCEMADIDTSAIINKVNTQKVSTF